MTLDRLTELGDLLAQRVAELQSAHGTTVEVHRVIDATAALRMHVATLRRDATRSRSGSPQEVSGG